MSVVRAVHDGVAGHVAGGDAGGRARRRREVGPRGPAARAGATAAKAAPAVLVTGAFAANAVEPITGNEWGE